MKTVFKEKLEYTLAKFNTKHGLIIWMVEAIIWGYIIVNYTETIYLYIGNFISISNIVLKNYISYLLFGLVLTPIGLIITFTINEILLNLFKNGRIVK